MQAHLGCKLRMDGKDETRPQLREAGLWVASGEQCKRHARRKCGVTVHRAVAVFQRR